MMVVNSMTLFLPDNSPPARDISYSWVPGLNSHEYFFAIIETRAGKARGSGGMMILQVVRAMAKKIPAHLLMRTDGAPPHVKINNKSGR